MKSRRQFLESSVLAAGGILATGAWAGASSGAQPRGVNASQTPSRQFLDAVVAGDLDAVTHWLDHDPGLLHLRDALGRSGYALALLGGHGAVAALLLERGHPSDLHEAALARDWARFDALAEHAPERVNQDHPVGGTAMFAAAAGGAGTAIWHVYSWTGDPNVHPRGPEGDTPLLEALEFRDLGVAEMTAASLLSNGADPTRAGRSRTPLHVAARRGSLDLIEMLLRKGADPTVRDTDGLTPGEVAERAGHRSAVLLLARHVEIPRDCSTSRSAYDANGARYESPDLSRFSLVERGRIVGISHSDFEAVREAVDRHPELAHSVATTTERAVEASAHTGQNAIVDYLLDHGVPYSLPTAVMRNDLSRIRALLAEDPLRIHERGPHDFPLLWYPAIGAGSTAVAELLLERGAEVERQHFLGTTALHYAASSGDVELCAFLLEHGADIGRVGRKFDPAGQTPLQVARARDRAEVIRLLRNHGAGD